MRDLTPYEIAVQSSEYLAGGYKRDQLRLDAASVTEDGISGTFSVPEFYVPGDGQFHFTLILGFVGLAQLGVLYAHADNGLAEKTSEVLITHLDLRCKKIITQTSDITITLRRENKIRRGDALRYSGAIDICNGSFLGTGKFWFPLANATPVKAPEAVVA